MPAPEALTVLVAKTIGSVCGTVLALIFSPPKSRREFKRRASFSVIAGVIMSPAVRIFIDLPLDTETLIATAAGTAFISWSAAGVFTRIVKAYGDNER